jgi:hypothetical protein
MNNNVETILTDIISIIAILGLILILISVFGLIWTDNSIYWKLLGTGGFNVFICIGAIKIIER